MEQLIIGGVIAFIVTFYAIPVTIQVAEAKKLFDVPDERKIHKTPIPSLGGLAMFAGLMIGMLLTVTITENRAFQYYLVAFLIIFFLGLKDDIVILSPIKKFIGQVFVAAILCFKGNLLITSMHGFLGLGQLDITASYLLTFFTIIVVINAFNLIDGIDGLAGSLGLVTCTVFGVYFYLAQDMAHAILGFTMAGSIIAFLIYNYNPAKIFMGDTGSMLLGVVNVILVIHFIEAAPSAKAFPTTASPAIGFGILLLPLMDTLRVFAIRIINRRSPFSPDRNHLHHILLERGMGHKAITFSIAIASILPIIFCFTLQRYGSTLIIASLIAFFFTGIVLLKVVKPRRTRMRVVKTYNSGLIEKEQQSTHAIKLVPLYLKDEEPAMVEEE
ncbi:UDP-N-acetylmuramyl pentapeptide phosphotransferase/UDP-N-acetylglucosamine-1-phosphate transferase [Filimonas lacunae]|uniref:UDP-N-acetylmuramyl pentapeptide phosphotransferase/UDP-N-acetylglucosamine-1-phosphate transferase n=1 Tax=Filimonas lacunae TaxID=477680 RepID=A0A173MRA8_9BACT|nr:MraY family glycosyltransferase [Filimonas lacunae]BAV10193.1 undecaprenyl-phosphate N-acetylglucosaminyl 1-phosphate transferase [Filimonas lacunae]SIT18405.1 UDP-N-acetylmuramyl pentapeptide phosphotransferase/UDP-N-acetylglucosamine-1-phosphate transferase [Filimonas lacunae]